MLDPCGEARWGRRPNILDLIGAEYHSYHRRQPQQAQEWYGTKELEEQRSGGYLLRTKSSESNEGGVAVGFSVIDTPLLV